MSQRDKSQVKVVGGNLKSATDNGGAKFTRGQKRLRERKEKELSEKVNFMGQAYVNWIKSHPDEGVQKAQLEHMDNQYKSWLVSGQYEFENCKHMFIAKVVKLLEAHTHILKTYNEKQEGD